MEDDIHGEIIEKVDLMAIAKDNSYEELLDVCRLISSIKNICNNIELWERNMEYYKISRNFNYEELFEESIDNEDRPIYASILLKGNYFDPTQEDLIVAMEWACKRGYLTIIDELILNFNIDPSFNGNHFIKIAVENGQSSIVKRLLEDSRVDLRINHDNIILMSAIEREYLEVIDVILKNEIVEPSKNGNDALMSAISFGYNDITKRLLQDRRVVSGATTPSGIHRIIVTELSGWLQKITC